MSALMLGLATLIRPITMLWPIIVVLSAVFFSLGNFRRGLMIQYLGVSTLPLIIWMSFLYVATGQFSMGSSGHDIPHNLYNRFRADWLEDPSIGQTAARFRARTHHSTIYCSPTYRGQRSPRRRCLARMIRRQTPSARTWADRCRSVALAE